MDYTTYPDFVVEDIVRLRRRIAASGLPEKLLGSNLIVGTWNIQAFGEFQDQWEETKKSPKRNLRGLACIAEVIRHFDVIAIQEVKSETRAIRRLLNDFLGNDWGLILSDVTAGNKGNTERFAFIFDKRRVQPSGLAGEIVLPPTAEGKPVEQFDRTPYIVGFQSEHQHFTLLTVHIRYGDEPEERIPELQALANFTAKEIRDRATSGSEERNLIVLGDFNIDKRGDNPLFQAFISSGLVVPHGLRDLKTTYGKEPKFYDQIAWFMGHMEMESSGKAGVIDFVDAVFKELKTISMTFRVSDHFPLWVEFLTDRSVKDMAAVLDVDPDMPDPFGSVPD